MRFLLATLLCCCAAAQEKTLTLPMESGAWPITATGKFSGWIDRRALLVLCHPWEESASGMEARAECAVTLPADWNGPVQLRFYLTDDYDGQAGLEPNDWRGNIQLPGHRFKQVLVDNAVVWERDAADAEGTAEPSQFTVTLPETLHGGSSFTLAVRLLDKTGSNERLPGDKRGIGSMDKVAETDPWRFMTHLYAGDFTLAAAGVAMPEPRPRPLWRAVRECATKQRLLAPSSDAAAWPVRLQVQGGNSGGFPRALRCGVPLPRGQFKPDTLSQIGLAAPDGKPFPSCASPFTLWEDGSVRWAALEAVIDGASTEALLTRDSARGTAPGLPTTPPAPVTFTAAVESAGKRFVAQPAATAAPSTALTHAWQASGALEADGVSIGRYASEMTAMNGTPYTRIDWRFFVEQPDPVVITRMGIAFILPALANAQVCWSAESAPHAAPVRLQQTADAHYAVTGADLAPVAEGAQAGGWLGLSSPQGSLCILVRHFAQQHPIALAWDGQTLNLDFFAPSPETPEYKPHEGEGKRYEIWIGQWDRALTPQEFAQVAAHFADSPRLMDAAYFCAAGARGRALPHNDTQFPDLTAFMRKTYETQPESAFCATGIRNWGDLLYNAEKQQWRNGYYDTAQGFAAEYFMTGDPRWFQRLEASARHISSVDICYASKEHPQWVGCLRGYFGADHSSDGAWEPTERIKGLLDYAHLTADRTLRAEALGVADWAVREKAANGANSVRNHAGVLDALVAANTETQDPKYLESARALVQDARKRIDLRRGCYAEVHGNVSYRGNVPWMVAQLAGPIFEYYEQSGDLAAAETMAGLAESIITENCTRGVDGDIFGYSHNPHFAKTSNYHALIAPILGYAWELSGDAEFTRHVRAMYTQTIAENSVNPINNCYWETPAFLYYLKEFAGK